MCECAFKNSSIPLCGLNSHERRLRVPSRFKSGFWCTLGSFQDIVRDQAKLVYLSTLFKIKKKISVLLIFLFKQYCIHVSRRMYLGLILNKIRYFCEKTVLNDSLCFGLSNIYFPSSKQIGKKNPWHLYSLVLRSINIKTSRQANRLNLLWPYFMIKLLKRDILWNELTFKPFMVLRLCPTNYRYLNVNIFLDTYTYM